MRDSQRVRIASFGEGFLIVENKRSPYEPDLSRLPIPGARKYCVHTLVQLPSFNGGDEISL